ncbi:MAG: glycosyltransferase family 39 protein [Elusimicrobia bacterium]|nr:glycosyltransferase family 39 protein [Elusimicrobiota bacterium]
MAKKRRQPDPASALPSAPPALEWRLRPASTGAAAFLVIVVSSVLFYSKMPSEQLRLFWSHAFDVIPPVFDASASAAWLWLKTCLGLALLHLSAWGLGRLGLKGLGVEPEDRLNAFLLASALGWGALGLAMLGLGLAGLWRGPVLVLVLGPGLAALAFELFLGDRSSPASPGASSRWTGWEGFLASFLLVLAGFDLFASFMPEIFYDALVYHLGLPELYWTKGGIVPAPELLYSGLPLMVQMLYSMALPLGGDVLCRALHWSFGVETLFLTFALGRGLGGRTAGLLAACLFYGIPLVSALSWKAAVEHGQAVFQTAAFLCLAASASRTEKTGPWAVLAGLLAGFAMGSKYQAWPLLPILVPVLWWTWKDRPQRRRDLLLFAGSAALMTLPWCLKNVLHYGNPVYPVLAERFGQAPFPRWRELMGDAEAVRLAEVLGSAKSLSFWLTHPWRIPFENMDHGSILFMVLPVALLARFRPGAPALLWLSWLGLWLSWSLTTRMLRYCLPNIPLACALTAAALETGFSPRLRSMLRAGLVYVLTFEAVYAMTWFYALRAAPVVLGRQGASEYLSRAHPSYHCPVQPAIDFVNAQTPPGAKVLFLGEARRYGIKREAVVMSYYDEYPLQWWLDKSSSSEDIRRSMAEAGVTHILVNRLELSRWQAPGRKYLRVDEEQKSRWNEFMSTRARPVFTKRIPETGQPVESHTVVYELDLSTAAAARARPAPGILKR